MTTGEIDSTILAAIVGGVVTLVGTILTYHIRLKKSEMDNWEKLQQAQRNFQTDIHAELDDVKRERRELQDRVNDLEKRVRDLVQQNEKLILEKIEWMQKATSLQMLLQKAMQAFPINTNAPLTEWLQSEAEKIDHEVSRETNNEPPT